MSISFTPSQLRIITLVMTEAEFMRGAEYTSEGRETLSDMFNSVPKPSFPSAFGPLGERLVPGPTPAMRSEWARLDALRDRAIENAIVLVERAYHRFLRELDGYTNRRCKLSEVRKYHRLLIDTLAPFTK